MLIVSIWDKIREELYLTIFCWFVVVRNNRKIKPTFILDIPGEALSHRKKCVFVGSATQVHNQIWSCLDIVTSVDTTVAIHFHIFLFTTVILKHGLLKQ